ncbi:MAG: AAA family ATPase [Oscillospiraceae bacterium]|jgi:predicted ATPase|nr:AAA family ATPase [Oscillospiraceae bacterium]
MTIKSITISGFKNLSKTKIDIDKIAVLVSPNNYGKSNLIEAINFGVDFITASKKLRTSMMNWVKGIPLTPELVSEEFLFEIEFDDPALEQYRYVKYGFTFSWFIDDGTGQRITNEWLETRRNESVRYSSFIKRDEEKYRKAYSTNAFRNVLLDSSQLAIDIISSIEDIEISNVIKSIQNLKYLVCSSLDLQDRFAPPPFEFVSDKDDPHVSFDDEDIPKALFHLRKNYPEKFNLFKDAIIALFPEFTDVSLQAFELKHDSSEEVSYIVTTAELDGQGMMKNDKKTVPFKVKEEIYRLVITSIYLNQPINASLMSTGTKRIIWLLANVFISSCSGVAILGVEELETSIHPKQLKKLLETLIDSQESTGIIASSHSPFLIQYLKPSQIYFSVPNMGTAEFRKIADGKSKALRMAARNIGVSIGEYLFELMSGDSDSTRVLSQYLEDTSI